LLGLHGEKYDEVMAKINQHKSDVSTYKKAVVTKKNDEAEQATTNEILVEAIDLQKKDIDIVQTMIQDTDVLVQQGRDVARELNTQGQKLRKVDTKFDEIDDGLKQSRKLIAEFRKAFFRDKCIRALLILILVGALLLLVWAIIDPYIHLNLDPGNNTNTNYNVDTPRFG